MTVKISDLRQKRAAKVDEMSALAGAETFDAAKFNAAKVEEEALASQILALETAERSQAALARPLGDAAIVETAADALMHVGATTINMNGLPPTRTFDQYLRAARSDLRQGVGGPSFSIDRSKHFLTFGEQLQQVFRHYSSKGTQTDDRLVRAPTGAGEVDPTGGGFLVQVDFASAIFMLAHDMGEIMGRCGKLPISANSNGIKIPGVDETSRATGSRWGGVQSYWAGEGSTVPSSKPKFRMVEFDLKKLMSTMYTTDEMLQDQSALTSIAGQAFSEEVMFMTEDAVIEGSGAGVPLGILNSPATVSVAKQTGQASATIVKENIDNMWSRCWARSRKNAVWFVNQDIEPQLLSINQAVGTGGMPVFVPAGGYSAAPYATLLGRPLVATEYNSTLGTVGDIILADLSQYMLADKGGVQAATSMHVAFLTDEMVFRITYRVDGKPMWAAALTPFKGSNTKSPFITLATR